MASSSNQKTNITCVLPSKPKDWIEIYPKLRSIGYKYNEDKSDLILPSGWKIDGPHHKNENNIIQVNVIISNDNKRCTIIIIDRSILTNPNLSDPMVCKADYLQLLGMRLYNQR